MRVGGVLDSNALPALHLPKELAVLEPEIHRLASQGLKARDISSALGVNMLIVLRARLKIVALSKASDVKRLVGGDRADTRFSNAESSIVESVPLLPATGVRMSRPDMPPSVQLGLIPVTSALPDDLTKPGPRNPRHPFTL